MVKLRDIQVVVKVRTTMSFWDAVKLWLSGAGYAVKQFIDIEMERRNDDAVDRDRPLS